jgi:nucleoside-diphosphate-sugar epimerase
VVEKNVILITGSSGLIGTSLIKKLKHKFQVVGLDVKPPDFPLENTDFVCCDLTKTESVFNALKTIQERHGNHFLSVIHLAAYYNFTGEPSPLYQELTINGTQRLLNALQEFEVEQFIFSSSLLVMKSTLPGRVLTENSPLEGEWDYPRSKIMAERVIHQFRGSIPVVILRIAGIYDEFGHSPPICNQIDRIYQKKLESHFYPGDPNRGQEFVHLDDAIEAFFLTILKRKELSEKEVFLIGEPDVMTYGELQDRVGELIHKKEWATYRIPKPIAKLGAWGKNKIAKDKNKPFVKPWMVDMADAHYAISIERAKNKLGWIPENRLRDTLPRIIGFLLEDPADWYQQNKIEPPDRLRGADMNRRMRA